MDNIIIRLRIAGMSVRCWVVCAMFPPSIFNDRYVNFRRLMINVSTFEN